MRFIVKQVYKSSIDLISHSKLGISKNSLHLRTDLAFLSHCLRYFYCSVFMPPLPVQWSHRLERPDHSGICFTSHLTNQIFSSNQLLPASCYFFCILTVSFGITRSRPKRSIFLMTQLHFNWLIFKAKLDGCSL